MTSLRGPVSRDPPPPRARAVNIDPPSSSDPGTDQPLIRLIGVDAACRRSLGRAVRRERGGRGRRGGSEMIGEMASLRMV